MSEAQHPEAAEQDEQAPRRTKSAGADPDHAGSLTLGLVADPDMPQQVAERLAEQLPDALADSVTQEDVSWTVVVEVDPVAAGRSNRAAIVAAARDQREHHGWDYAVCITDLPLRGTNQPILSEIDVDHGVAVLSLPALGGLQPYRRARQQLLQIVDELRRPEGELQSGERHGLASMLTMLLAPIYRQATGRGDSDVQVRYLSTPKRGRLRLLSGMVRTNKPWRLVFGLSRALAAAVATSAFGLSSSTIWKIGYELGPLRETLAIGVAIAVLVGWLIASHHLWETRNSAVDREQARLYNSSTVLTLLVGVACMYALLFAINLALGLFLVPSSLLSSTTGETASFDTYLALAWSFSTMGVIAGALGSSLESDRAVRQAAYGYRESQRRAQQQQRSSENE